VHRRINLFWVKPSTRLPTGPPDHHPLFEPRSLMLFFCFSFYSSQGRQTSFMDHNSDLIERLQAATPGLATLEVRSILA
jgi:hypothetical protein